MMHWKAWLGTVNINRVLSFVRTSEDNETPIILSRIGKTLWASSAPKWYIPADRIRALEKLGMDFNQLGRWMLYKRIVEFNATISPNFSQLINLDNYPIELLISDGPNPKLVYFNDGEYRTPRLYYNFVVNDETNLRYYYHPKRQRMIIVCNDCALGVIIAGPVTNRFNVSECSICKQPGKWSVTSKGRTYSVCCIEHEKQSLNVAEFLSGIGWQ